MNIPLHTLCAKIPHYPTTDVEVDVGGDVGVSEGTGLETGVAGVVTGMGMGVGLGEGVGMGLELVTGMRVEVEVEVDDDDDLSPTSTDNMMISNIDINSPLFREGGEGGDGIEGVEGGVAVSGRGVAVSERGVTVSGLFQSQQLPQSPPPQSPQQQSPNRPPASRRGSYTSTAPPALLTRSRSFRPPISPTKTNHRRGSKSSQIALLAAADAPTSYGSNSSNSLFSNHHMSSAICEYLQLIISGVTTRGTDDDLPLSIAVIIYTLTT